MNRLETRLISPDDDISAVTRLLHSAYSPLAMRGMRYLASHQGDEKTRERASKGECYLTFLGDELVATITLSEVSNTKGSPWYDRLDVISFGQFAVRPDLQHSGIGSQLVELVEERAREKGATELALDTSEHADDLIRFYTRRGYRFIEYAQWDVTNYRSVVLSKSLSLPSNYRVKPTAGVGGLENEVPAMATVNIP